MGGTSSVVCPGWKVPPEHTYPEHKGLFLLNVINGCTPLGPNWLLGRGPSSVGIFNGLFSSGEHFLSVWLSKVLLPRFPIAGYAYSAQASINSEKVILTGHGLQTAQIRNEAEFVIDGTEAGPGKQSFVHTTVIDMTETKTGVVGVCVSDI